MYQIFAARAEDSEYTLGLLSPNDQHGAWVPYIMFFTVDFILYQSEGHCDVYKAAPRCPRHGARNGAEVGTSFSFHHVCSIQILYFVVEDSVYDCGPR